MKSSSALKNHKNENRPVDGTYVLWLAFDGDKIIGTSGMSFAEKPPYFMCTTGRIGILSSMHNGNFMQYCF